MVFDTEHHVRQKPLKRKGLSKYYSAKSQSFSSLELALTTQYGENAMGLAKSQPDLSLGCSVPTSSGLPTCSSSSGGMTRMASFADWSSGYMRSDTSDLSCCTSSAPIVLSEEPSAMGMETQSSWMPQTAATVCDDLCRALSGTAITRPFAAPNHAHSPARHTSLLTRELRPVSRAGSQLVQPQALLAVGKGNGHCSD